MRYLIIAILILLLVFGPGLWVKRVLSRYARPNDRYSGTGGDLARHLLDNNELQHITVEKTDAGDHYDPVEKAVRLTED